MKTGSNHQLIDRCIYCGAQPTAEDPLSDEHIIPYGLGGTQKLLKASCAACSVITSRFEGKVQREDLIGLRAGAGFPTRHKKNRPERLRLRLRRGEVWADIDVPPEDYMPVISLPTFRAPANLDKREYVGGIEVVGYFSNVAKRDYDRIARKYDADEIAVGLQIQPEEWARMLAKIAYATAVSNYGLDRIEPYVVQAVLGNADDIGMWVGCDDKKLIGTDDAHGHTVALLKLDGEVHARVKPFDWIDAAEYHVVVGKLR